MQTLETVHATKLGRIVASSAELMEALRCVRSLGLRSWCIGAGAIRNLVWDSLHGRNPESDSDVDVVFFDGGSAPARDAELEGRLRLLMPGLAWEVTNQAHVHLWFERALGQVVPPLGSLAEGVATWPEFATCVGVYLADDGSVGIVAPHGLNDLFEMRVRHNPVRASAAEFHRRIQSKRFRERWPGLAIAEA
jgi:hypothetical protein